MSTSHRRLGCALVLLIGEYKFRPDLRFDTMLELGLTDGAPDLAVTLGVRKRI